MSHRLRSLSFLALATAVLAPMWAACHEPQIRTAPFRQRPDAVVAGDLRGPFDGRVVDATTGSPVAGALVYATWTVQDGYAFPQPAGFREFVGSTDATGRYQVPRLTDLPSGAEGRVASFQMVVYKRGYVAYRSDRRFADFGPRMDFAQRGNEVRLERWRPEMSHARHLRYVGGGPAIAALTGWEVEAAVAELSGETGTTRVATDLVPRGRTGTRLVAAQLLSEADVRQITGYDGGFETGPLGDDPDTASYSSQHFKALGRPESFDIALRLWNVDPDDAAERYDQLVGTLPGVEQRDELADRSLRATEGDIFGIAFLDRERGVVALLTCGKSQCKSMNEAVALGERISQRLRSLWPRVERAAPIPDDDEPGADGAAPPLAPQPKNQPAPPAPQPKTQPAPAGAEAPKKPDAAPRAPAPGGAPARADEAQEDSP